MTDHLLTELTVFILAVFVGLEVISRVPTMLHTPLMSATNAIHGIVLVGAILVAGAADAPFDPIVGFVLVLLASLNVFGGYTVTERMLADVPAQGPGAKAPGGRRQVSAPTPRPPTGSTSRTSITVDLLHLRPALPELAEDGAARQPHQRGRHADRGRRDAEPGDRRLVGASARR